MMTSPPTPNTDLLDTSGKPLTPEQFLEKLRGALRQDGDFPANARIVGELRTLANDPRTTANQLTELILREPTLGARVLHLVNSSFYRRSKPVMTVSQAVIQIGMKALIDLCAGLVLLQKFVGPARRGGPFATCLQQSVITSLLTSSFAKTLGPQRPSTTVEEGGYLAGLLAEIGPLLVAYYFPQVYDRALKRAEAKGLSLSQSLSEMIGLSRTELSIEVIRALELPDLYAEVIAAADKPQPMSKERGLVAEQLSILRTGNALFAAKAISESIASNRGAMDLDNQISKITRVLGIEAKTLAVTVGELPSVFAKHCATVEVSLPTLPDFIGRYASPDAVAAQPDGSANEDRFNRFVEEIREAVASREPPASIITTVMETVAGGLDFERVLLLLLSPGKKTLVGRMTLGNIAKFDPKTMQRSIEEGVRGGTPDGLAFAKGRPIYRGDPLLPDGWPLVAIPVGLGTRCIGVIYADRINSKSELTPRDEASIGLLVDLLDRALTGRG
jgi:HD-like signal output (HDOD) protein